MFFIHRCNEHVDVLDWIVSRMRGRLNVKLHVEDFKSHRFGERAIAVGLKLAFFSAILLPKRIPVLAVPWRWNVYFPMDVFARLATVRAPNRVNGLVAAKRLATVDACPRAIANG